ncbi:helix-turn-helix transcriptional regulator [Streptomyces profundus]|uniref:helix-turn-helix transcriptional regulator n=1 Tax=Streptomyces profundus TaxID=2867410 RepID=UPI002ADDBE4F|nr:helix-turn-helix domain-containing protein [Streptomyces sp. MA3_2.13]UED86354.1 helix-turn-helix domain-containing protein [Streptomyces sp. MA3_2.13]
MRENQGSENRKQVNRKVYLLTIEQVCSELQVSRSTFYDWRQKRRAPQCVRLPSGALRVRRAELDSWLAGHEEVAR